jgi:ring-1,2-phenylacetyl-CoA epoxidase subunit PaaB
LRKFKSYVATLRVQEFTLMNNKNWPLWEVFIRSKNGLAHKHAGSLHAADAKMAIENARDVYTRRMEGVSIWVVKSQDIVASSPADKDFLYEPANDKVYRHPTFYEIPPEVGHM